MLPTTAEHQVDQKDWPELLDAKPENQDLDDGNDGRGSSDSAVASTPEAEHLSKRALKRAMFGVNRRSGGRKHKKKGTVKTDPYLTWKKNLLPSWLPVSA